MRQRFEISEIWADALDLLPETVNGQPPGPLPATCPWTLDDLLEGGTARATGANVDTGAASHLAVFITVIGFVGLGLVAHRKSKTGAVKVAIRLKPT